MAPMVDINLNEVVVKPPLPDARYALAIVKADLRQAAQPNKNTGQREWGVNCELRPLNAPRTDYIVYKTWSLAPGALESSEPEWSIKKFFELVHFQWGSDGKFRTEDMTTLVIDADVKQIMNPVNGRLNPQIIKIYGLVA